MDSPHRCLLHLGTQQQISEEEDVPELPGALRHLHQEAVLHQLTSLREHLMSLLVAQTNTTHNAVKVHTTLVKLQHLHGFQEARGKLIKIHQLLNQYTGTQSAL